MTKISIKTPEEIETMAEGGRKLAQIRDELAAAVRLGTSGLAIDKLADKLISKTGGKASFKMVTGYHWATCININETVVHGIPDGRIFKEGDIVGIDVGLFYKGFHTDTSTTVRVGERESRRTVEIEKFVEIGRLGLKKAIELARPGKRIWDLSQAMQLTVEKAGFSPVKALTGHGIGRALHEEPAIPCFTIGQRSDSPKIVPGMVLAIEIMYNEGTSEVVYKNRDGWTIITGDDKISGLFEETVAVMENGPQVLTTYVQRPSYKDRDLR